MNLRPTGGFGLSAIALNAPMSAFCSAGVLSTYPPIILMRIFLLKTPWADGSTDMVRIFAIIFGLFDFWEQSFPLVPPQGK
jgi:hypothetical protein